MPSKKKTCRFKDIVPIRGGRGPAKPQLRKLLQLGHKIDGRGGVQLDFQTLNFNTILNFWMLWLYEHPPDHHLTFPRPLSGHHMTMINIFSKKNSYLVVDQPKFQRHIVLIVTRGGGVPILKNVPIKICSN